jgi:hypothetical protein
MQPEVCCNRPEVCRVRRQLFERPVCTAAFECRACGLCLWGLLMTATARSHHQTHDPAAE